MIMQQIDGASLRDRATAAEPEVSALRDGIPSAGDENPVVGWGTTADGAHVPIRKDIAEALFAAADAAEAQRKADMPTEQSAIAALFEAQLRLKDFGWQDPIYAPKDGSPLELIELGSTGIHRGHYDGEWPTGCWYLYDGDLWPSRPALARATQSPPQPTGER
jgi:hypothetical protein